MEQPSVETSNFIDDKQEQMTEIAASKEIEEACKKPIDQKRVDSFYDQYVIKATTFTLTLQIWPFKKKRYISQALKNLL
jgi:hypothetical protein